MSVDTRDLIRALQELSASIADVSRSRRAEHDQKGDAKPASSGKSQRQDKDEKDEHGSTEDGGEKKNPRKRRWPIVVLIAVVVVAIVIALISWLLTRNQESTDDAYTEGNAVAISPKVSGYIVERHVDDNTFVHAGDLMLRIDPRDYLTARDQARANLDLALAQLTSARIDLKIAQVRYPADRQQNVAQLAEAKANLSNARRTFDRQHSVDQRATTQATVDQATAQLGANQAIAEQAEAQLKISSLVDENIASTANALKQREAQVEQAQANLTQAELNLSYTQIRAPQDGRITRRNVDVGTFAQAGQQVFYIVSPNTWVVANFKETQLDRMRVGQHVTISVDAYSSVALHGHIQSIQQGSGARFTTFPAENATGNFVKIVRRVPVKILIDDGIDRRYGLPLGLSVIPTVQLQ